MRRSVTCLHLHKETGRKYIKAMWRCKWKHRFVKCNFVLLWYLIFMWFSLFIFGSAGSSLLHGLFCSRGSGDCSLAAVCRLLIVAPSRCGARALGARLQQLCCTGFVAPRRVESSRSGMGLVSPVLPGGLFTTEPPGKLCITYLIK